MVLRLRNQSVPSLKRKNGRRQYTLRLAVIVTVLLHCIVPLNAWSVVPASTTICSYQNRNFPITALEAKKAKKKSNKRGGGGKSAGGGGGFGKKKDDVLSSASSTSTKASPSAAATAPPTTKTVPITPGKLIQISESPLIFTMDHFMDPDTCTALSKTLSKTPNDINLDEPTQQFCLAFRNKLAQTFFNGHMGRLDGIKFNYASSSDANNDASQKSSFPDGVHMDTNNACIFRHLTAILYLNDVDDGGGATAFPLASSASSSPDDNDAALQASRRLLHEKIGHTRSCGVVRKAGIHREADAALIEKGQIDNDANAMMLRVQPRAGKLLLFFSRTDTGEEDPRSWHGGERLLHSADIAPTEKHILTIFKQVDYQDYYQPQESSEQPQLPFVEESTFESYLSHQVRAQRQALRAAAMTSSSS